MAAFERAIDDGADAIELDVVSTRDGHLIARHDNELSLTTDIASRPQFAEFRSRRRIEGLQIEGWFAQDLSLQEVRSVKARQRFAFRDSRHDGLYAIPMLDEVLELARRRRTTRGRPLGVLIEIKHPTHFAAAGLPLDDLLIDALDRHGMTDRTCGVILQSFEVGILQRLHKRTQLPLFQLLDAPSATPADLIGKTAARQYADMITPAGLADIAEYADGIGAWKRLIVPTIDPDFDEATASTGALAPATTLIADAHAAGLLVCAWTFRNESRFLAPDYHGDPLREYEQFYRLGVDGVITDFPETAITAARTDFAK